MFRASVNFVVCANIVAICCCDLSGANSSNVSLKCDFKCVLRFQL